MSEPKVTSHPSEIKRSGNILSFCKHADPKTNALKIKSKSLLFLGHELLSSNSYCHSIQII